jgi:hypothetical protein
VSTGDIATIVAAVQGETNGVEPVSITTAQARSLIELLQPPLDRRLRQASLGHEGVPTWLALQGVPIGMTGQAAADREQIALPIDPDLLDPTQRA